MATSLQALMAELDPRTVARRAKLVHEDARASYMPPSTQVETYEQFLEILGDYYNHHFAATLGNGHRLPRSQAVGRAREIVTQAYRRQRGSIRSAFLDARDGTRNGLRGVLDGIADALKQEAAEAYVRDVLDRHVSPVDPDQQTEIVRQLFERFGPELGDSLHIDRPDYYARDVESLIRAFVEKINELTWQVR
ncbi:MAG: hypothetical protein ACOC93_04185 [Planctomycetota bacterium]